ncbi:hypothetical protein [Sporosarcina beigongshangi]|uniref:hypothetical protein n=1 Tax=Sporosarcina beigongshangi TaxID=2782538 RepID=UPI0019395A76|nr:hypothetical protein [Sporosarcina beigongshangi]
MSKKNNLKAVVGFVMLACSFLLVSCQQQTSDKDFEILVFSTISKETLADMQADVKLELENVDIALYPSVAERLMIEIVRHAGDILIMDRELLATAYDSKELYSLDEFRDSHNTVALTDFEIVALQAADEEVETGQIYPNAIRVTYMEKYEVSSEPIELVAIIPKYTKNKETAFSILKGLVQ